MALLGSFTKQPSEILPVDISFATVIGGRAYTLISPVITVPTGMTQPEVEELSGTELQIYVGGGTTGETYQWKIVTTITIGGKDTVVEDEFDVAVLEV